LLSTSNSAENSVDPKYLPRCVRFVDGLNTADILAIIASDDVDDKVKYGLSVRLQIADMAPDDLEAIRDWLTTTSYGPSAAAAISILGASRDAASAPAIAGAALRLGSRGVTQQALLALDAIGGPEAAEASASLREALPDLDVEALIDRNNRIRTESSRRNAWKRAAKSVLSDQRR